MKHRILVAGGAGYIGSHVQKQLLEDGFEVAVFDNLSSGDRKNILPGAAFIEGNILNKAALNAAMRQEIDGVVHLAAKKAVGESMVKPELYAENNISGSINILNAMAENGVKHIVFSSSAAVYGMPEYVPIDEDHRIAPINYYGYTKVAIEENMRWYARLGKLNYAALRYFNAVGYPAEPDADYYGSRNRKTGKVFNFRQRLRYAGRNLHPGLCSCFRPGAGAYAGAEETDVRRSVFCSQPRHGQGNQRQRNCRCGGKGHRQKAEL